MRCDYEAEEAVLNILKENNLPAVIYSEEHGKVEITKGPKLTGVLDGIDGSHWYKSEWGKGRYGTMFGIYEGLNPQYKDYLFGGIMEHATKRLFYGVRGQGAWILNLETGIKEQIHVARAKELNKDIHIHIDEYWDINNEVFTSKLDGFNILEYKVCSSVHYADTSMGASDLTLECTRKGNLEIAAAYPLITEAGGIMVSLDGHPLGEKYYLEFGQKKHMPVITAATPELANQAVNFFKNMMY